MRKSTTGRSLKIAAVCVVVLSVILLSNRLGIVQGQQRKAPGEGFAAIPGLKGGQDVFGPYDPVQKWPKPLSESLPNHEGWTWSQSTYVFAESPDRVFVTQKGELPVLPTGLKTTWLPQIGPGIKFPVGGGVPLRETASATPAGARPQRTGGTAGRAWIGDGSTSLSCSIATAT